MAIANLPPEEVSNKLQEVSIRLLALRNLINTTSASIDCSSPLVDTLGGLALIIDDQASKLDELATALVSKVIKAA